MQIAVPVQFSGNAKEYLYVVSHLTGPMPEIGDRAVVPSAKLKDDGSLSLSVATVCGPTRSIEDDPRLLPVVHIIGKHHLNYIASLVAVAGAAA